MSAAPSDGFLAKRQWMVEGQVRNRGVRDERVLRAMLEIPRHSFAPPDKAYLAYEDQPLEIGERQTISQPYITAVMLQALAFNGAERCLEVGTGSGYATALLSLLAAKVYTVERHERLLDSARERLAQLGYASNVVFLLGDGSQGVPQSAPYDAVLVSAAAPDVPQPLIEQLAPGGRMVVPVGNLEAQELLLVTKTEQRVTTHRIESCRFVPLIGSSGFQP